MKSFSTIVLTLLAVASSVSAHGYVSKFTADGKDYKGNEPNNFKVDSPIRLINDISPVKGANNKNVNCGPNAQKAKLVAPVTAGSTVKFEWMAGGGQGWPHNTGPIMNYMAKCDGNCANFDSTKAKWFKVSQDGRKNGGAWVQADLMAGKSVSMTVPKQLASGQYLIRHEIVALHLATKKGGAEFYPSCIQVEVKGGGNSVPSQTVSFPGAYSDSDPGIFDPNVFNAKAKYTFPGPQIATFSGGRVTVSNSTDPTDTTDPAPASTSSEPAKPSPTKHCKSPDNEKRVVKRHIMHNSH